MSRNLLLPLALLSTMLPAQVVQLENGKVVLADVQEAHDDGITIKRLDNGGVLQLRWDQLSAASALGIKQIFGLSVDEESEVLVSADVLVYVIGGGSRTTAVGKIVEENSTLLILQRKGVRYPIPRSSIRRRTTKSVPVLDIYTKDQFYNEKLAEIAPGEDADKHILLADLMMRVRQYAAAEQHLLEAKKLGGGSQKSLLDGKLRRVKLYREAAAERAMLDEIGVARARRQFPRGLALIKEFSEKFQESRLATEFAKEKLRFQSARERYLVHRISELWYRSIWTFAKRKANESGVTYAQAREYAEAQMGKDLRDRVAKSLDIDLDEVDTLWQQRSKVRGASHSDRYAYGVGSWTLGAEAIKKDTKQATAESRSKGEPTAKQKAFERLAERIRRAVERAKRSSARSKGKQKTVTPEDWWRHAKPDERALWVRAYYAEFGGDLEVTNAYVQDCPTCAGKGFLRFLGQSGKEQKVKCPTCHGTRHKRILRAR